MPVSSRRQRRRSGWSQGQRTKGNADRATTRDGRRAAIACPRDWNVYDRPQGKGQDGNVFTALLHHVDRRSRFETAFLALTRRAAPGVDGVTWTGLRVGPGGPPSEPARPGPSRRVPGAARQAAVHSESRMARERPLGYLAALEDKIVQRAIGGPCSTLSTRKTSSASRYGFPPGRGRARRAGRACAWRSLGQAR